MFKKKILISAILLVLINPDAFAECNQKKSYEEIASLALKDANDLVDLPRQPFASDELITSLIVNNRNQNVDSSPLFIKSDIEKVQLDNFELSQIKQKIYLNNKNLDESEIRNSFPDLKSDTYSLIEVDTTAIDECSSRTYLIKEKRLIIPKKIVEIQGLSGETRYLLPIELWKVYESESGAMIEKPYIELFLFKKKQNVYQLVSRTPPNYKGFDIDYFDRIYNDLANNITKLGNHILGTYFENVYLFQGYVIQDFANWEIILFNENDYIRNYVLDSSRENVSSESVAKDLQYKYFSTFHINNQNNDAFYPIEINYSGTVLKSNGNVKPKDGLVRLVYDPRKKVYTYDSETYKKLLEEQ